MLSAEQLAQIHARRDLHPTAPKMDAKKAWAALKKLWQRPKWPVLLGSTEGELRDRLETMRLRAAEGKAPEKPEEDGLLYLLLMHPDDDEIQRLPPLLDFHVAHRGLVFAIDALFCMLEYHFEEGPNDDYRLIPGEGDCPYRGFLEGWLGPWRRLRLHLATAPEAAYQAALARARLRWATAGATEQAALAYLFPDSDFAGRIVDSCTLGCVLLSLRDPVEADRLLNRLDIESFYFHNESWDVTDTDSRLTLIANLGSGALPALLTWFRRNDDDPGAELALFEDARVFSALIPEIQREGVQESLQAASRRFPALALPAIVQVAISRGKAAAQAQILLSQIFRADPEGCLARLPELPDAGKKLLEGLKARLRPSIEATPEQLPSVLQHPPWLAKKGSEKVEKVQLSLETLPIEPQERWPEGLRESWLEGQENWQPEEGAGPRDRLIVLLDELGLKHSYAKLADSPDTALRAAFEAEILETEDGWASIGALTFAPEELALWLLNHSHPGRWWTTPEDLRLIAATYGGAALPGLIGLTRKKPLEALEVLLPFGHPGGGPLAAGALRRKRERAAAERWLRSWPEVAAITLLPLALGKAGKERENAEVALRWLHHQGFGALLSAVAQTYGAAEGLESLLNFEPLSLYPAKMPKMPDFWDPGSYGRPRLRSGEALPLPAVEILGQMLAFSELDPPYAGIVQVREACDPTSLADFARDVFDGWSFAGLPTAGGWVLRAQGLLGNDDTARRLTPLIRAWPGEGGNARALVGLEVLAALGSDVALMHLNGIAQKVKFRGLQEAAREKIRSLAELRGLDEAELADRLVPDLGLEEDGSLVLDFGPRQYTVGFDELLRPYVKGSDGKIVKELPRGAKSDDPEKAKEATETWKNLKKDAKTLASQQLARLEAAMCTRRRWSAQVFELFLARHPLLQHVVRRLAWGQYTDSGEIHCFRVAEDGSYADAEDNRYALDPALPVGLLHRLEIEGERAAATQQIFEDYGVMQPFSQLGREIYHLQPEERSQPSLLRWQGRKVYSFKLISLEHHGWRRGLAEDAGFSTVMLKNVGSRSFVLELDPGILMGMIEEYPEQTLGAVTIGRARGGAGGDGPAFGSLDPIVVSELIRDLERVTA
jgi:Domain of unknown function (DUF4132)